MFEIYNHTIAIRSSFLRHRGIYHVYQTFSKHQPIISHCFCVEDLTPVICWVWSYFIMFYLPISRPGLAFQDVPGLRLSTWPPHRRAAQLIGQVPVRDLVQPPNRTNSCCNRTKILYVADYSKPQLYRNHMKQVQLATAVHITTNITLYPSVQYICGI